MSDYRDRVANELQELAEKEAALVKFMYSDAFHKLEPVDTGLLMVQLEGMRVYMSALERRIERFVAAGWRP